MLDTFKLGIVEFNRLTAETFADPNYGKILVLFDTQQLSLSRIIELIESHESAIRSIEVIQLNEKNMKIAKCKVTTANVSHMVIELVENLSVEANGWDCSRSGKYQAP